FRLQHEIMILGLEDIYRGCPASTEASVLVTEIHISEKPRHAVLHRGQFTERVNFDDWHFRFLLLSAGLKAHRYVRCLSTFVVCRRSLSVVEADLQVRLPITHRRLRLP